MKIASSIIILIYSSLMIFSSFKMKDKISKLSQSLMIIGSGLNILFSILIFFNQNYLFILIVGLVFIHISAILNGLKLKGKINPLHHIIRLIISVGLVLMIIL